jgi:hypothetical protein
MVENLYSEIQREVAARGCSTDREGVTGERTANMTMKSLRTAWYFFAEKVADLPDCPVRRITNTKAWFVENEWEDQPIFLYIQMSINRKNHKNVCVFNGLSS